MVAHNDQDVWLRCDVLYTPFERLRDRVLHIARGKIQQIIPFENTSAAPVMYQPDAIVAPGYVDLHVHGARGRDLMDGTLESLQTVASTLAAHGTTSFLATTLSAPDSDTEIAVRGFANHSHEILDGARPIGIHMEGPYLNPVRKGTHNADYLRPADPMAFRRFVELSNHSVRKMTVAPEMDHGLKLIRAASEAGIQISIGHSDATAEQAKAAIDAGALQATHVFNAMRPFHQREPGILGVVLTDDRVSCEVISDGIHVHRTALQLLWRIKGAHRTILITDGLSAVGMEDGQYPLGDKTIVVSQGECRDLEGTLAGSTLTLDRAVRNVVDWLGAPLEDALAAASATPAQAMQLPKGVIVPGADADLIFLDSEFQVMKTMVAGRIVYTR
jgi:N-acetylglucosamine-6-phosphate deacetylase